MLGFILLLVFIFMLMLLVLYLVLVMLVLDWLGIDRDGTPDDWAWYAGYCLSDISLGWLLSFMLVVLGLLLLFVLLIALVLN